VGRSLVSSCAVQTNTPHCEWVLSEKATEMSTDYSGYEPHEFWWDSHLGVLANRLTDLDAKILNTRFSNRGHTGYYQTVFESKKISNAMREGSVVDYVIGQINLYDEVSK
jgi:hypothetical protein